MVATVHPFERPRMAKLRQPAFDPPQGGRIAPPRYLRPADDAIE